MTFTAAVVLLGLALATPASAGPCPRYRVVAERNDLTSDEDVERWATEALKGAGLFDKDSPCFVQVRISAGPIRAGGRQDGWVAHVSVSTRKYVKEGKLVANEKGMLLVEAQRESLVASARTFVEECIAKLK